ncbi:MULTISPECIES: DMT family transporter [Oerskovia]|uniref:DMT family transporter n=2 Tax=Oerskovia TaxID=162491 RepID=A0ABR8V079_9CELL|nr:MULTISPECIES: DMT family transporter [Oerskovia]MBD7998100.1 DMT family transporter [Oerskovia gallyi]MBM7495850.1 drug/metabolite transporter (DMT)-like permease [Oerskovia paurometabola]
MTVGALCGIGANLIWGLAFLVPVALPEADSISLALGRYLCFGAISVGILAIGGRRRLSGLDLRAWSTALLFAFTGHFGYYLLLVQGIRWAGAPITTVIIGMLPVSVAIAGNLLRREFAFARLVFPLVCLSLGLSLVYLMELDWQSDVSGRSGNDWAAGIASAVGALALWTSYAVSNAQFVRRNPQISSMTWSTMMGAGAFVLALAALPFAARTGSVGHQGADGVPSLIIASVVLGGLVSWAGTALWNRSSGLLPISVAGQLTVIQVVAGLTYVFVWERRIPPVLELLGFALIVVGVLDAIRRTRTAPAAGEAAGPVSALRKKG